MGITVVKNVKTKKKKCGERGFILILRNITQVSEEVPEIKIKIIFICHIHNYIESI